MKPTPQKPRICFALPGIHYTPHSPYVRSTLPMMPYLAEDFDVTLVYRKVLDTQTQDHQDHIDHTYLTVIDQADLSAQEHKNQHSYFEPTNYVALWKYQTAIHTFAQHHAQDFDLVIEKEWPWLGAFSSAFRRYKIPTVILIEAMYKYRNYVQPNLLKELASLGIRKLRPYLREQWSGRADGIVVETDQMKSVLLDYGYALPDQPIYPIPYGVDPEVFCPRDRALARQQLGIPADQCVLTYVGSLNRFIQEPAPIIEALGREQPQNTVLHIVGDGNKRHELEAIAREFNAPVVFHGRVPQRDAALHIGASNLCIAPYDKHLYLGDRFTCASLKVPEYLSCGRAVLTIPCDRMHDLVDGERYGFLVENQVESYRAFFRNLPSRDRLAQMERTILNDMNTGVLKQKKILLRWWDIADMYKQVIDETLSRAASKPSGTLQLALQS